MQWIIEATRNKIQQLPAFRDWTISEINSNTFTITDYTSTYEEYVSHFHPRITTQISQLGIITINGHIKAPPTTLDIANPTTTPESIIAAIQHHQATILKSNLRYLTDK